MTLPELLAQSGSETSLVCRPSLLPPPRPCQYLQGSGPLAPLRLLCEGRLAFRGPLVSERAGTGRGESRVRAPGTSCALGPGSPTEPTVGRAPSFRGLVSKGDSRGLQDYLRPYLGPNLVRSFWGQAARRPRAPSSSPVYFSGVTAGGSRAPAQEGLAPSAPGAEVREAGHSALWQKKRAML